MIILKLSMSVHTFGIYDDIQFGNLIVFFSPGATTPPWGGNLQPSSGL